MLEPLTALSVAGSIIQIVDFGSRLFALTARPLMWVSRGLERASTSTAPVLVTQAAPTEHLPAERNGSTEYSQQHTTEIIDRQKSDKRLCSLARRSHVISIPLLKVLESIKKKDEIDDYLKQLEPLRGELILNPVDAMRNEQSGIHMWLPDIVRTSEQAQINNVDTDHPNPGSAIQAAHQPYTPEGFLLMRQDLANRISKWYRDLLKIRA
ncbi:hypothetical protein MBLNU13_g06631t1 [Cladosporium sp. NU13]